MDKAIILARGRGTRMRQDNPMALLNAQQAAAADTGVKAMIPIGRPFLDYVLSTLADAGFRRICLVVGPEHDQIRRYYGEQAAPTRLSIEFAVQQEARGTADALLAAESFAADDPCLMLNSDNYYPLGTYQRLRQTDGAAVGLFAREGLLRGNIPEERLRRFAVAQLDEAGCLQRIIEKPDRETWAGLDRPIWISMNCWRFTPNIFDACRRIEPSPRGELELISAVQYAVDRQGEKFQAVCQSEPVYDLTSRADIPAVTAALADLDVRL